jgi:hypothetical protein
MNPRPFVLGACVFIIAGQVAAQDFTLTSETNYTVDQKPHCVRPVDLNNDGLVDLVSANRDRANVTVFIGNGDGTFQSGVSYPAGPLARDIAIADYDGDNYLDLAVANERSDSVSVLINNGDGTFPVTVNYLASHADYSGGRCRPWHIESSDYDLDGWPDFAVTVTNRTFGDATPNDEVYLFLNRGDGTFQFHSRQAVNDDPRGICAGDFNRDGYPDFAVGCRSGFIDVFMNTGDATFVRKTSSASYGPVDICAADFDGDNDLDIAMLTERDWTATIMINDGNGSFNPGNSRYVGEPWSINSADMDGDGDEDLLVAATHGQILANDGNGGLRLPTIFTYGGYPRSICAADFDGDGDNDLSIANAYKFFIVTWENTTPVPTAVEDDLSILTLPTEFELSQNYPNPFNPATTVTYSVPKREYVDLRVYNILGQQVITLVNEYQAAGIHSIVWVGKDQNGKAVATGIYFYRIRAGDYIETKKMMLLK